MLGSERLLPPYGSDPTVFWTPEFNAVGAPGLTVTFNMPTWPVPGKAWMMMTNRWQTTARDGTVTTGPVVKVGNNVTHDNWIVAGTPLGVGAAVKNALNSPFGTPPLPMPDASLGPLVVELVTAAVLGTATELRGRFNFLMLLVDLAP